MRRREFWDPEGIRFGRPTFPWHMAPSGLATRRQLAAMNPPLRPGGQEIAAQVAWYRGRGRRRQQKFAHLYPVAGAPPKRPATPAQLAACRAALIARMTCPSCGLVQDYCIPTSLGECLDCAERARRIR
jgi:hypothetical protein